MKTLDEATAPPSKTQRKRAMEELQALGEDLVTLAAERLKKIDLPEELRAAVDQVQRMTRHDDARRRQMQYVGRLMRDVDPAPIRAALAAMRGESLEETARLHRIERRRADLLADEKVLYEIANAYPSLDLQHLRSLRRAALLEQERSKPPRSYRAIFQLLKDVEGSAARVADDDRHDEQ
nr:ribosome biogenesis factor YjgA [Accumulibacter sp.]